MTASSENLFEKYLGQEKSNLLLSLLIEKNERNLDQKLLLFLSAFQKNKINILEKIQNNEISIHDLSNFTIENFNPEFYENVKRLKQDKYEKELNGNSLRATTDLFQCKKCKERKCSYYELQTRSADEPMTKFIKCCNCGFEWKQ
jgi:transcription elongation factor S-II